MKQIEESENSINANNLNNKKIMNCFLNSIISYRVHSIKVVEYYLLYKENLDYLRHIKYLLNILDENELKLYELHYLVKYY